jgi:hypothetical protein
MSLAVRAPSVHLPWAPTLDPAWPNVTDILIYADAAQLCNFIYCLLLVSFIFTFYFAGAGTGSSAKLQISQGDDLDDVQQCNSGGCR